LRVPRDSWPYFRAWRLRGPSDHSTIVHTKYIFCWNTNIAYTNEMKMSVCKANGSVTWLWHKNVQHK
jgi:hypothetical protein